MAAHDALVLGNLDDVHISVNRQAQADTLTVDGAAARLLSALATYTKFAAGTDVDTENSGEAVQEAATLSLMAHMQRFSLLCNAARTPETSCTSAGEGNIHKCLDGWAKWLLGFESQPIVLASKVALCLPPLQACWRGGSVLDGAGSAHIDRIEEAIGSFFARAARRCVKEWAAHGTPLRTLLPPMGLLATYARFRWAWSRFTELRRVGGNEHLGGAESSIAVVGSTDAMQRQADRDIDFLDIAGKVESCHTDKLTREVLLHSLNAIDWRAGNAVPTVKGVAPLVWCLFLRCRSYALHNHSQSHSSSSDFFVHEASARLVAQVLRCTVDGVRVCIERQAADMHVARARQLCTCDIPCLVLLTRLWFTWIALATDAAAVLLPRLECSLRQLVSSAVKLRGGAETKTPPSSVAAALEENSGEASRTEQETLFVEVAWKVTPLSLSEIVSATAAVPWTGAFARASEVQAVLEKRTIVASVP
ncbi:conserved hypothetical protein [Leishmania mexicana MHOM/GT/2001/U1103]|uniref:Uncharacterized protein n=1 Tax=Leishmania mexicana (strain MHOM/GT/2001/U1103) TaxID=929439 RepID=E9B5B8_LEIMU|nr:conserved hypothetical protein [Leishmania mexicana MHOM/GT/2001/U1103]CBZ30438.1 conserved hypothetical protein [Leishmania mexicana MHOM/GT/2001/U1103]